MKKLNSPTQLSAHPSRFGHLACFFLGASFGTALTCLSVPSLRKRIRAQFLGNANSVSALVALLAQRTRSVAQHGYGFYGEATRAMGRSMQRSDDEGTKREIRATIQNQASRPNSIDFNLNNGVVQLSGSIPASEIKDLVALIERIPGVRQVIDQFEVNSSHYDIRS